MLQWMGLEIGELFHESLNSFPIEKSKHDRVIPSCLLCYVPFFQDHLSLSFPIEEHPSDKQPLKSCVQKPVQSSE